MKDSEKKDTRENVIHEQVARRARELWEQEGKPDGKQAEHWAEAEKQLFGPVPTPGNPVLPSTVRERTGS
jgi:hypothetical protein